MAKRLYSVNVEATVFVVAESEAEAERVARDAVYENDGGVELECLAMPETNPTHIPTEWRGAIPYGGDGSRLVEDYLPKRKVSA